MNIQAYETVRTKNLQSVNILCTYSVVNCLTQKKTQEHCEQLQEKNVSTQKQTHLSLSLL